MKINCKNIVIFEKLTKHLFFRTSVVEVEGEHGSKQLGTREAIHECRWDKNWPDFIAVWANPQARRASARLIFTRSPGQCQTSYSKDIPNEFLTKYILKKYKVY